MALPAQAQYMSDKFNTDDFVLKTFINNNVDNTWMLRQNDVVILVDEDHNTITLQLGGSSHAEHRTGKVKSEKIKLDYHKPSKNVGDINDEKKSALQNVFSGTSDNLYDAFVEAFGEDKIISDNR